MGVFCPITEEYCATSDTTIVYVDGRETRVSNTIYFGHIEAPDAWQHLGRNIGWTDHIDYYTYDEETEEWYSNEAYEQLLAEREEEQEEDKDEAA